MEPATAIEEKKEEKKEEIPTDNHIHVILKLQTLLAYMGSLGIWVILKLQTLWAYMGSLGICTIPLRKPLYTPLPKEKYIRLLRLHPGKPETEIKCSLQVVRLDNTLPAYESLSYQWMLREGMKSITCNGYRKDVHKNLFDALERIRLPNKPKLIWVDQLCINQDDIAEKDQQVRQMHHVYKRASRVIVWLGTDDTDEAHPALATICTVVNNHRDPRDDTATFETRRKDDTYSVRCTHPEPPYESNAWITVESLFENRWFTRMWVLQEIALAEHATIFWGLAELEWEVLGEFLDIICSPDYHYHYSFLSVRPFRCAVIMNGLRKKQRINHKSTHPFLHLMDLSRCFDVTAPQDKVYGLLGFPTRPGESYNKFAPQPYSQVTNTYIYVAKELLLERHNLDTLGFALHTDPDFTNKESEYPSWVPDWNCKEKVSPLMGYGPKNRHKAGRAFGRPKTEDTPYLQTEIWYRGNSLTLSGVEVDVLADYMPPQRPFIIDERDYEPALKILIDWCLETPGISASTLSTILTANRDIHGYLIEDHDQHLADFAAILMDLFPEGLESIWPEDAHMLEDIGYEKGNRDLARFVLWKYSCYRTAFRTKSGRLGIGPAAVQKGDIIVVLWGGQVPYVLREKKDQEGFYYFVGECYIDGIMKGEIGESEGYVDKSFRLV